MSIKNIYEKALFSNEYLIIEIGVISKATIEKALKYINKDLTGFKLVVDTDGIRHTLKGHGNPIKEAANNQIAVSQSDIELLSSIINTADKVENGSKPNTIKFTKKVKNKYIVIEEIRLPNIQKQLGGRLALKTMWIKKA